ncbi:MAG: FAD-dependent oxidoreductase [Burkholderiaceae bacterium]
MRVAIIGSGIAGLAAAHHLRGHAQLTLFEANNYFGGHTHTVDVTLPGHGGTVTHGVDTGFLVFNERTYPRLIALLAELGVASAPSEMSFSVQVAQGAGRTPLEWSGSNLASVFAQRSNLLRPAFWGMLRDILRFNALTTGIALGQEAALQQPLGEFLQQQHFGKAFCDWYFLPMMACIWSCPTQQMLQFPVATMIRFCHNHGLLQISDRPPWHTVRGGARQYVQRIVEAIDDKRLGAAVRRIERRDGGVLLSTDRGTEYFDRAIIAVHSDQALRLLHDPRAQERATLGAIQYHDNRAVLHTDSRLLPTRKSAWAAWNYERALPKPGADAQDSSQVCLHYLLNLLQPLPWAQPVIVSLNPLRPIRLQHILGEFHYAHPVFDLKAIRAQTRLAELQGYGGTYYCGAWTGYGFHEDGLKSGEAAARQLLEQGLAQPRKAA